MAQTTIFVNEIDDFNADTGEMHRTRTVRTRKSKLEPTDEFIKVSKYLNVIFAYNKIPLTLVPISLIISQRMEFKTNKVYLLKSDKLEIMEMLGFKQRKKSNGDIDTNSVDKLIRECVKYDIIRRVRNSRGKYEVNSYLFSTGSVAETKDLQAHFDFDKDAFVAYANQKNLISGEKVRKIVANKKNAQIPGQMSIGDILPANTEKAKEALPTAADGIKKTEPDSQQVFEDIKSLAKKILSKEGGREDVKIAAGKILKLSEDINGMFQEFQNEMLNRLSLVQKRLDGMSEDELENFLALYEAEEAAQEAKGDGSNGLQGSI